MLNLSGDVNLIRGVADHWVWQREPLCAFGCWIDLLVIARQERGEMTVHGTSVTLERGDVGFAIHSLAARWRRNREWTTKFLRDLEERRMVELIPIEPNAPRRGTIIRITNFNTYNPATEPTTDTATGPTTEQAQSKEVGRGSKEERRGEGTNFPTIEVAVKYLQPISDYSADEIRSAWHELTATAVDGCWMLGRRAVGDWRSALESECWKRRQIFGSKKNPARPMTGTSSGEPPRPHNTGTLTFADMKGAIA